MSSNKPFWPRVSPHFLACRRGVRAAGLDHAVAVGLSGGADSLALLAALVAEGHEVLALCVEYGLNALALVPHMVFLVDFVARGLGQGIAAGSYYWVLYGIGAVVGPLLTGHLADRAGFAAALRAAFLIEAVAVALPAVTTSPAALIVSSLIVGGFTPGIVPLVIGRIHELIPHSAASQRSADSGRTSTSASELIRCAR